MNLEDLKVAQMSELLEWFDDLENILTPDNIVPVKLKDFPLAMETSERLKRVCRWKATELKKDMQAIEDNFMDSIESQEYIFKYNGGGQPVMKKKYPSADKRNRELRRRLSDAVDYKRLATELQQWEIMCSDWISHVNRLRREMRLLEMEHLSSGASIFDRSTNQSKDRE